MRILIVDDDKINCLGIQKWIEEMHLPGDAHTDVAYCAEETLSYARLYQVNLLITDIQMGGMNGLELIEEVQNLCPGVVPVIITAYARFPYAHRAIQLGADSFLLKPFGREELREALEKAISRIQPEDIRSDEDYPIQWAKRYVKEHMSSEVNMAVIANELNLSYTYFSKLFRQETGMSFSAYVTEKKMQKAGDLLAADKSIAEVSAYLGYGSQQNFSRAFSNYWGCSPNSYRRKRRGPNP